MDPSTLIEIGKQSIWVLIKISLPMLLVALVIGLIVSLFQALTQIQEPTLSFVPKIIAIFMTMLISLSFIGATLSGFSSEIMTLIINVD